MLCATAAVCYIGLDKTRISSIISTLSVFVIIAAIIMWMIYMDWRSSPAGSNPLHLLIYLVRAMKPPYNTEWMQCFKFRGRRPSIHDWKQSKSFQSLNCFKV